MLTRCLHTSSSGPGFAPPPGYSFSHASAAGNCCSDDDTATAIYRPPNSTAHWMRRMRGPGGRAEDLGSTIGQPFGEHWHRRDVTSGSPATDSSGCAFTAAHKAGTRRSSEALACVHPDPSNDRKVGRGARRRSGQRGSPDRFAGSSRSRSSTGPRARELVFRNARYEWTGEKDRKATTVVTRRGC